MPSVSQKQANLMRACGHGADYPQCAGIRSSMGPKIKDFYQLKSHMPKGATQSPKGDLGERRVAECDSQRGLKNHGGQLSGSRAFGSSIGTIGLMGERSYHSETGKPRRSK